MREKRRDISAVILAGGKSARMGADKAELIWNGMTLLEHQVKKVRSLGIDDIILSGYRKSVDGTRPANDVYPGKGPLGGIHAGLLVAQNPHCLILSVDVPLVPEETLIFLMNTHLAGENSITVLSHGGKLEPLIGVYEQRLSSDAACILRTENTSVRVMFERVGVSTVEYTGDEVLLFNCNTPSEYITLLQHES